MGLSIFDPILVTIEQEAYEIEHHLHSRERWKGKTGTQTATDWSTPESLIPFRAISGTGAFGTDANDEAQVSGTADTPIITGMTKFDVHEIMLTAASNATDFILRIVYGTGTMADAETAGQYSDIMFQEGRKGAPIIIQMPRLTAGTDKVWMRAKNATNNATADFFIGVHEYER